MGVSGSGKSTLARALAEDLKAEFIEADEFHPPSNKAKMATGRGLTDADRGPWLAALRQRLEEGLARGRTQVLACSALKEAYRATLRAGLEERSLLVWQNPPYEELERRLKARQGHFAGPALLASKWRDLEPPEGALEVGTLSLQAARSRVRAALQRGREQAGGGSRVIAVDSAEGPPDGINIARTPDILVVDDVPESAEMVSRLLVRRLGCRTHVVGSGEKALAVLATRSIDLILLDVMLPGMGGFKLCEQLQGDPEWRDVPIIFITARTDERDVLHGLQLGAVDYVGKPIRPEVLLARVRVQLKMLEKERQVRASSEQRAGLVHVLCHDIANPIAAIRTCLQFTRQRPPEAWPNLLRVAELAVQNADGMIAIVRQSLALTDGKTALSIEPCELGELVEESLTILDARLEEKELRVEVRLDDLPRVRVDRFSFVNSVLNNLLTNAIKFSHPRSVVRVSGEVPPAAPGMVELVVEDMGIGMPPELLASVFDFSSATSRPGTKGEEGIGYGLPLLRQYVEAMGGTVQAASLTAELAGPGETPGTTVRVRVPRA
ncbi:MAG: gluconokinase, GntK/IdnK-type [Opitutales bacterium]